MKVETDVKKELKGETKITVPDTFIGLKGNQVRDVIERYKGQIIQAVPKHVTAERIIQICTTVINRTPEIMACTSQSIIGAVMQASILGLDLTPQLGLCYFIPYRNRKNQGRKEVQFQLGYRGLITLARRSGEVKTIYAYVVYKQDKFKYELGLNPILTHKPSEESCNRKDLTHTYAVIKYKDGGESFIVMTRAEVYRIKASSKAADTSFSPWKGEFEEEMWKKTALKRLLKYAPLSTEQQKNVIADEVTIKPDSFDTDRKELDPGLVEFNIVTPETELEEELNKETGELKENEKLKTMFLNVCRESKGKLKTLNGNNDDYYKVLKKRGVSHSTEVKREYYGIVQLELEALTREATEGKNENI